MKNANNPRRSSPPMTLPITIPAMAPPDSFEEEVKLLSDGIEVIVDDEAGEGLRVTTAVAVTNVETRGTDVDTALFVLGLLVGDAEATSLVAASAVDVWNRVVVEEGIFNDGDAEVKGSRLVRVVLDVHNAHRLKSLLQGLSQVQKEQETPYQLALDLYLDSWEVE